MGRVLQQLTHAILVLPYFTFYVIVNGFKRIFEPSAIARSLARAPRDVVVAMSIIPYAVVKGFKNMVDVFTPGR